MVKVVVDIWRTGLHKEEIGIKKKEEHRAKTRKFTKDMDLFGRVKIDKEDYGLIGYRKELWEVDDPINQRIDIRLFTNTIDWLGTLVENFARSIVLSLVNEQPSLSFVTTLRDTRYIYPIERIRGRFMETDTFLLTYVDENNQFRGYTLKVKRVAIGGDWDVYDALTGEKVAKVDGKVLDIGGRWEIKTDIDDKNLLNILSLFAASLKFYDDAKKRLEKVLKNMKKNKNWLKLAKTELSLFYNPRVRR